MFQFLLIHQQIKIKEEVYFNLVLAFGECCGLYASLGCVFIPLLYIMPPNDNIFFHLEFNNIDQHCFRFLKLDFFLVYFMRNSQITDEQAASIVYHWVNTDWTELLKYPTSVQWWFLFIVNIPIHCKILECLQKHQKNSNYVWSAILWGSG